MTTMKRQDYVKCPHCEHDPTSEPARAKDLIGDSRDRIAFFCEHCDGAFTLQDLGGGDVNVSKANL